MGWLVRKLNLDGTSCPTCQGTYLREEFGRPRWHEFKCLAPKCSTTFAIYDYDDPRDFDQLNYADPDLRPAAAGAIAREHALAIDAGQPLRREPFEDLRPSRTFLMLSQRHLDETVTTSTWQLMLEAHDRPAQ